MSAVDFMKQTLEFLHRGFRGAPEGLSDEQLHFVPEGQSHSIAWVMWHASRIEDLFVQQIFQGQRSEWDTGGWAAKTGLPEKGFGTNQPLEEARAVRISNLDAFRRYVAKIEELSGKFFTRLTDDDLGREV